MFVCRRAPPASTCVVDAKPFVGLMCTGGASLSFATTSSADCSHIRGFTPVSDLAQLRSARGKEGTKKLWPDPPTVLLACMHRTGYRLLGTRERKKKYPKRTEWFG